MSTPPQQLHGDSFRLGCFVIILSLLTPFLISELFLWAYDAFHLEPLLRFLATFVVLFFLDVLIVFVSCVVLSVAYECFFPKKLDSSKEERFFNAFPIYFGVGAYFLLCIVFSGRIQEDWNRMVAQDSTDGSSASAVEDRYWVTKSTGKTHNSSCRYYENSRGYFSSAGTGNNCKICGGAAIQQEKQISPNNAPDNWAQGETESRQGSGMDKSVGQVAPMGEPSSRAGAKAAENEKKESDYILVDENTEGVYWYSFEDGMRHRDTCEKFGKGRDGYFTKKPKGRPCAFCCHDEPADISGQASDIEANEGVSHPSL